MWHDFGKMLVDIYLPEKYQKIKKMSLSVYVLFSNKCGTHVTGGVGNVMKYLGALLTNGECSVLFPKLKVVSCRTCLLINCMSFYWLVN